MWEVENRGFLPVAKPYPDRFFTHPSFKRLAEITSWLPMLVEDRTFRFGCSKLLSPLLKHFSTVDFTETTSEWLFKKYAYIASAYVHLPGEEPITILPNYIAIPLVHLANKLKRKPILSYASYCLNNWSTINYETSLNQITVDNITLQQNFCYKYKSDEDWFILIHVDIEARAAEALLALNRFKNQHKTWTDNCEGLMSILADIDDSIKSMNQTLSRMPERCRASVYYKEVRPFIFSFENIIYEGCYNNEPQTYRGETGAQSSIIPALVAALGIYHKSSLLTEHLDVMREYMPENHRRFIVELETLRDNNSSLRRYCLECKDSAEMYNKCVNGLLSFRMKHLEYAINYIYKKVNNPQGTGGTPFIPWLKQLKEETENYLV